MQDKQKKSVKAASGYTGNVTVKKTKNGKVKGTYSNHNAGTPYFFEQLNKLLVGIDTSNNMPKYIDCGYATNAEAARLNDFNSVLIRRVPITSKTVRSWVDDSVEPAITRYTTVLSGLITYLDISGQSGIKRIALFPTTGTDNNNMLANVALDFTGADDGESGIKLDVGEALLVEWSMSFDNVVEAAE